MLTFGIEEECFLVERTTLQPAPIADRVRRSLHTMTTEGLVTGEFLASQIERSTPILTEMDVATSDLSRFRTEIEAAARMRGAIAIGAGTPFDASASPAVTEKERYRIVQENIRGVLRDHQICATHIHVGVPSRDAGVEALNRLRVWLPTLMALSGNSPFWRGSSTGFDSWRAVIMRRWTTTGCPPHFVDAADYDRRVRRLVGVGATTDVATVAWFARLSEVHPTLEVRVADAQLDVEPTILLAALTRGLVATALDEAERNIPPLNVEPELLDAALWHAARDGIRGNLLNPTTGELTPACEAITALVRSIEGSLNDAGDQQRVTESLERLWRDGTGAEQQERAFATKGRSGLSSFLETSYTSSTR